jgi:hypothetical protein
MKNLKQELYENLRGGTLLEKFEEVCNLLFLTQMIDRWKKEDEERYDALWEIKKEMEEQLNNGRTNN